MAHLLLIFCLYPPSASWILHFTLHTFGTICRLGKCHNVNTWQYIRNEKIYINQLNILWYCISIVQSNLKNSGRSSSLVTVVCLSAVYLSWSPCLFTLELVVKPCERSLIGTDESAKLISVQWQHYRGELLRISWNFLSESAAVIDAVSLC